MPCCGSETDTLIASGTLDDHLRLRATANCPTAEGAERVEKTLAAAVTLGLNGIEAMKTRTPPGAGTSPHADHGRRGRSEFLKQVKISRSQTTIEATVEGPLDSFAVLAAVAAAVSSAREAARHAQARTT